MKSRISLVILIVILHWSVDASVPIDQIPMYGGIDRLKNTELAAGDIRLIEDATKEFGSKREASQAFVDRGFRLYQSNDLVGAMKRFNQAWLIDESNPEVYHGFGSIIFDKGQNCEAMELLSMALGKDWGDRTQNQPGYLADLGMIISLCAYTKGHRKWGSKKALIKKSNKTFKDSENLIKSPYLYDKWWQALYWRGDYKEAWAKVQKMREAGGFPHPVYLNALRERMPEPSK